LIPFLFQGLQHDFVVFAKHFRNNPAVLLFALQHWKQNEKRAEHTVAVDQNKKGFFFCCYLHNGGAFPAWL
jgi:hypothetical protein